MQEERIECIEEVENNIFGQEHNSFRDIDFELDIRPAIRSMPTSPSKLESRKASLSNGYNLRARNRNGNNWSLDTGKSGILNFWLKQKRLKGVLRDWNKNTFGNVFSAVQQAEDTIQYLEQLCESSTNDQDREALDKAKTEYDHHLNCEEIYWGQISGLKWLT